MSRHPDRFRDKRLRRDIRIERPGLSERSISGSYRTGPTRFRDRPKPDNMDSAAFSGSAILRQESEIYFLFRTQTIET